MDAIHKQENHGDKQIYSAKKHDFPISETDFVRHFVSEHLIGATQIAIKKLQQTKD